MTLESAFHPHRRAGGITGPSRLPGITLLPATGIHRTPIVLYSLAEPLLPPSGEYTRIRVEPGTASIVPTINRGGTPVVEG